LQASFALVNREPSALGLQPQQSTLRSELFLSAINTEETSSKFGHSVSFIAVQESSKELDSAERSFQGVDLSAVGYVTALEESLLYPASSPTKTDMADSSGNEVQTTGPLDLEDNSSGVLPYDQQYDKDSTAMATAVPTLPNEPHESQQTGITTTLFKETLPAGADETTRPPKPLPGGIRGCWSDRKAQQTGCQDFLGCL
jgi:hypothetical protein